MSHHKTFIWFVGVSPEKPGQQVEQMEDANSEQEEEENKVALDSKVSDMAYLKAKMVTSRQDEENDESDSTSSSSSEEDSNEEDIGENEASSSSEESEVDGGGKKVEAMKRSHQGSALTLKMRGLPFKAKDKDIIDFFSPLKLEDIRFIKDSKGKAVGVAFVDFASDADVEEALRRNKDCIKNRYIELFRDAGEKWSQGTMTREESDDGPWMKKIGADGDEDENIAEVR